MNLKYSHIALAFIASASFCAVAETIVPGSEINAKADIVVAQDAKLSLAINPAANLTVTDIRKGRATTVAKFKVDGGLGGDTAVRLVAAPSEHPDCAFLQGAANNNNKILVCLDNPPQKFSEGGIDYFKYGNGEYQVVGHDQNALPTMPVGADSYNLAMELVRYTN